MVNIFRFGNVLQVIKVVVLAVTVLMVRFVPFRSISDEGSQHKQGYSVVLRSLWSYQPGEQISVSIFGWVKTISRVDVVFVYFYSYISEIRYAVDVLISWYTPPMFDAAAWSVVSRRDWVDRAVDVPPRLALDEERYRGWGYLEFSGQSRSFLSSFRAVSDLDHLRLGEFRCTHKEIHSTQTVSVP